MLPRFQHKTQAQNAEEAAIAELLAAVAAIPRDELPDGDARQALSAAVRAGAVIGVYRALGFPLHNIELRDVPRDIDPRASCADWQRWTHAGVDPAAATTAEQRARQSTAQAARGAEQSHSEQLAQHREIVARGLELFAERQAAQEVTLRQEQSGDGGDA